MSSQRNESNKEYHVFLKTSREDDIEVTLLIHDQFFKLSKNNDKMEKNIIYLKKYIEFL